MISFERVLIIGRKEFTDNITGKRFIALLAMLLILTGTFVVNQMDAYYDELNAYSSSGSTIMDDDGNIIHGEATYKPSAINLFYGIVSALTAYVFGPLIAIAMGFDAITKERETGSIKSILSHPLYRDELINGKALGGISSIAVATTIIFILTLSILLIKSIVPDFSELGSIIVLWIITVLYLAGIYAMSLMTSVLTKRSGIALIYSLILFFAFAYLAPTLAPVVTDVILGPEPGTLINADYYDYEEFIKESESYYSAETAINDIIVQFSMQRNYEYAGRALTLTSLFWNLNTIGIHDQYGMLDYAVMGISLEDFLEKIGGNIIFLFAYPIFFFGIAYVRFMRMDLR
ncbi:MAG: ABC transporter permease subunit [Methanomicrobium sp.]|nr:ABC transporter permease subunit [Methanomicrobium sp.]